jgi:hypothetical protein
VSPTAPILLAQHCLTDYIIWCATGIACTKKMVKVKDIENATFTYQKIFGEDEFFAAGVLNIQVNGEKAPKNSRDNVYVSNV